MSQEPFGLVEYYRAYPHAAALKLLEPREYVGRRHNDDMVVTAAFRAHASVELSKTVARQCASRVHRDFWDRPVEEAVKKMRRAGQPLDTLCLEALGIPVHGRPEKYDFDPFKAQLERQAPAKSKVLAGVLADWWWTANGDSSDAYPDRVLHAALRYVGKIKKAKLSPGK